MSGTQAGAGLAPHGPVRPTLNQGLTSGPQHFHLPRSDPARLQQASGAAAWPRPCLTWAPWLGEALGGLRGIRNIPCQPRFLPTARLRDVAANQARGERRANGGGGGTWGSVVFPEGGGVVADHLRTKPPLLQMNESFRSFATKIC